MKHIAAIDFGFDCIKIIYGKSQNGAIMGETFLRDIPLESRQEIKLSGTEDYSAFYDQYHNAYFDALESILEQFHPDTQFYVSFSSLFGTIFTKVVHTSKKKNAKIAATLLAENLARDGEKANYSIIEMDKIEKQSKILIYSYQNEAFKHFKELLENLDIQPKVIEFDAISLANCATEFNLPTNGLFLDIGFAKTNILNFQNDSLKSVITLEFGFQKILQRIANRLNTSIHEAKEILFHKESAFIDKMDINLDEIYTVYFAELKNEIVKELEREPSKIYITGGVLTLPKIEQVIATSFFENSSTFSPLDQYPEVNYFKYNPAQFTVALGLFLRSL